MFGSKAGFPVELRFLPYICSIFVYPRWSSAAILDFWNSKVAPYYIGRPRKPHPRTKYHVDRQTVQKIIYGCATVPPPQTPLGKLFLRRSQGSVAYLAEDKINSHPTTLSRRPPHVRFPSLRVRLCIQPTGWSKKWYPCFNFVITSVNIRQFFKTFFSLLQQEMYGA